MIARKWLAGAIAVLLLLGGCLVYRHEAMSRELLEWNNDGWLW